MKKTLGLEKGWLEGLHNECLPTTCSFPEEIRGSISFASRKVGNPLLPLMVKWTLEPAGVPQASIVPLAYSVHLLEVSSSIIDCVKLECGSPSDRRVSKLLSSYGEALCILCVDAMVTMSFQLLTELPANEFMELSDLLVERFGARGVLGKKTEGNGDWKGDMLVVSLEASSRLAGFESPVRRKIMNYAKKMSGLYRELETLTGEPPGREVLLEGTGRIPLKTRGGLSSARTLIREIIESTKYAGTTCLELHSLSEGVVDVFDGFEKAISRSKKREKVAAGKKVNG